MATYEYLCDDCLTLTTAMKSIADRKEPETCPNCGGKASFIISAPMFKLEGISGDYPTAYDKWAKKRRQKLAQEQKANRQ